jgi:hypothetical protein
MDESRERENTPRTTDWKLLAERASKEMDPVKLMRLVLELSHTLDEQQRNTSFRIESSRENKLRE